MGSLSPQWERDVLSSSSLVPLNIGCDCALQEASVNVAGQKATHFEVRPLATHVVGAVRALIIKQIRVLFVSMPPPLIPCDVHAQAQSSDL